MIHYFGFTWSGGNYAIYRHKAAIDLINKIKYYRQYLDQSEPITLIGHSHGGNVCIEAINMMVNLPEFDKIQINLLTINTPVRKDYQLNNKALTRKNKVSHINIYDPRDPVQVSGGNIFTLYFNTIFLIPSKYKPYGEYGPAGRQFRNAQNIEVDNPQGVFGDFHNSHNRVEDWENKIIQSTKSHK